MAIRERPTVREFLANVLGLFPALIADSLDLQVGGGTIRVRFGPGGFDVPRELLVAWITKVR